MEHLTAAKMVNKIKVDKDTIELFFFRTFKKYTKNSFHHNLNYHLLLVLNLLIEPKLIRSLKWSV